MPSYTDLNEIFLDAVANILYDLTKVGYDVQASYEEGKLPVITVTVLNGDPVPDIEIETIETPANSVHGPIYSFVATVDFEGIQLSGLNHYTDFFESTFKEWQNVIGKSLTRIQQWSFDPESYIE